MLYIQQGVLESSEERKKFRYAPRFAPAGQSTQMIVGATAESDKDILSSFFRPLPASHDEACLLFRLRISKYIRYSFTCT